MENIHKTSGLKNVSKSVIIPNEWEKVIKSELVDFDTYFGFGNQSFKNRYTRLLGIDEAELEAIEASCSLKLLACEGEPDYCDFDKTGPTVGNFDLVKTYTTGPLPVNGLETLKTLQEHCKDLEKRRKFINYRTSIPKRFIFASKERLQTRKGPNSGSVLYWLRNSFPTQRPTIVSVRVLRPLCLKPNTRYSFPRLNCEFVVHSNQYLTALKDRISCSSDLMPLEGISNESQEKILRAEDKYKGSYFFINNTFYNDMRHPNARDLSEVVINWADNPKTEGIGKLTKGDMATTTFAELNIKIGYPYLYCHQGDCNHLIIFNDIRLQCSEDPNDLGEYPAIVDLSSAKGTKCMPCNKLSANWVTINNIRTPQTPTLFCERCFNMFNFDASGNRIGEFEAYPFLDVGLA